MKTRWTAKGPIFKVRPRRTVEECYFGFLHVESRIFVGSEIPRCLDGGMRIQAIQGYVQISRS